LIKRIPVQAIRAEPSRIAAPNRQKPPKPGSNQKLALSLAAVAGVAVGSIVVAVALFIFAPSHETPVGPATASVPLARHETIPNDAGGEGAGSSTGLAAWESEDPSPSLIRFTDLDPKPSSQSKPPTSSPAAQEKRSLPPLDRQTTDTP